MKVFKVLTIIALAYVGIVTTFESILRYFQPESQNTLVMTITNTEGVSMERVLVRNHSRGHLYVSANHWPRSWYNETLENPYVSVDMDGITSEYLAVPVERTEHDRVDNENPHSIGMKILIGFAPRAILRLDSVE